jgi:xanthine dehydrogenase accessory factor
MLVWADREIVGTIGGGELEHRAIDLALEAIRLGRPQRLSVHLTRDLGMCCGGAMEVYVEPLVGVERVHVFGAGHVGTATALLLQSLEFEVHVYDDRPDWLNAERLPDCTLVEGDPRRKLPVLGPDDSVLIITHSHALDQDLLEALLPQPVRYLGMIGSRAKVAKFFVRLRAAGVDQALFRKVCAPVGLDIGAETPEEIAVAIAAEMIRVRRSHSKDPLPLSANPLPARGGDGVAIPPGLEEG